MGSNFEVLAGDLPNGSRRIIMGRFNDTVAQIDFFGELAEIARKSPTFERDLKVLLVRALVDKT